MAEQNYASELLHECSNCGWVGKAKEHVYSEHGFKRCPRCMERGIELNTEMLYSVPSTSFADEVASVLVQLDELAATWGDEAVFRRCRDRLRAALKQAKGE